jgi:pilus assembly protein CpaB
MRPKSLLLIAIALGCGLVASIGISQVIEKKGDGSNDGPKTSQVLVAKLDVTVNEVLTPELVVIEEWPVDKIPEGALSSADDLNGRRARQPLYSGEPILEKKIISGFGEAFARKIAKGFRVVSVKVSMNIAVSGLILPGDRVDVMVFLKKSREIDRTSAKTILSDVTVFAINDRISRDPDGEESAMMAKTVSLLVKPDQAEKLMLAEELGTIRLSLRRTDDDAIASTAGADVGSLNTGEKASQDRNPKPSGSPGGGLLTLLNQQTTNVASPDDGIDFKMQVVTPTGITVIGFAEDGGLPRQLESTDASIGVGNVSLPGGVPINPGGGVPVSGQNPPNAPGIGVDAAPGGVPPASGEADSPEFDFGF